MVQRAVAVADCEGVSNCTGYVVLGPESGRIRIHSQRQTRRDRRRVGAAGAVRIPRLNPRRRILAERAAVSFVGLVRNHNGGRRVRYLEYQAYEPLALKVFERIAAEARERWPGATIGLHHRIGRLEIGEASVAIATRSPHRGDAYAANRYAIERIKQIAPIWKHEFFDGGEVWIEGATANPDDPRALAEAERIACA